MNNNVSIDLIITLAQRILEKMKNSRMLLNAQYQFASYIVGKIHGSHPKVIQGRNPEISLAFASIFVTNKVYKSSNSDMSIIKLVFMFHKLKIAGDGKRKVWYLDLFHDIEEILDPDVVSEYSETVI